MAGAWGTETERLEAVLSALGARADGATVVVVEGALGTGKSTLLTAVGDDVRRRPRGPLILRARAARGERDLRYGVVRQLLHGRPAPAAGASAESIGWLLRDLGGCGGLLVLVDDAEHADDASLTALEALEPRAPGCGLLLTTARAAARPALLRLQRRGVTLPLGALQPRRVGQLVRARVPTAAPAYVDGCLRLTGGIPLLLEAMLEEPPARDELAAAAPERLVQRVRAELSGLSPDASLLAQHVAVAGTPVSPSDAMTLTGLDRRAVGAAADELAAAGLLRPGAPLAFAQPVLATAVEAAVAPHARSALHRQAARLLASQCAVPDRIEAHLLATFPADEPWVAERLVQAAHRAELAHDPGAVVRLLARAAAEPPPVAMRASVLVALAGAKLAAGDASAGADLEQALRLPAVPSLIASARGLLAQLHHLHGRTLAGLSVLEESLTAISGNDDARDALLARYLTMATVDARFRRRAEEIVTPLLAAAGRGELPRDPGLAAHLAWRLAVGRAPAELVTAVAGRALAGDPLVDPRSQGNLLGFAIRALLAVDEVAAAERACTRAVESSRARGMVFAAAFAHYHRALAQLDGGALDGALADVLAAAEPVPGGWHGAEVWRCELTARIHLAGGDTAAARRALALAGGAPATSLGAAFAGVTRARLALDEDRPAAALELAAEAGATLAALGQDVPALLPWRHVAARAAARAQRPDDAQDLAAQAVVAARAYPSRAALGSALVTAGVVAPSEHRVALLREACEVLAGSPVRLTRAEALIFLGRALRQAGSRAQARTPLREGLDLARTVQAMRLVHIARSELVAAGARPRRDRLGGPAALTAAERRVADLAAAGRSNAGIGGELSVDRKTVESHLAQVYRKLGISGRRELPGALAPAR